MCSKASRTSRGVMYTGNNDLFLELLFQGLQEYWNKLNNKVQTVRYKKYTP